MKKSWLFKQHEPKPLEKPKPDKKKDKPDNLKPKQELDPEILAAGGTIESPGREKPIKVPKRP